MAWGVRIMFVGALQRVTARNNHGQAIDRDDPHRERFLDRLADVVRTQRGSAAGGDNVAVGDLWAEAERNPAPVWGGPHAVSKTIAQVAVLRRAGVVSGERWSGLFLVSRPDPNDDPDDVSRDSAAIGTKSPTP